MSVLLWAKAALLGAAVLWPLLDRTPDYTVECTVYEVLPDGGKTPRGNLTVLLHPDGKAGVPQGWTPLEGTWNGDPNLSVRVTAADHGGRRFPLDVQIESRIGDRGHGLGHVAEKRDDFVMEVHKADDWGGHYEFHFHRPGRRWYQALLA